MYTPLFTTAAPLLALCLCPLAALAQGSSSWVDVGPGNAAAGASTDAPFGIAQSESQVGAVNYGRGLAVGFGRDGLSLSHSIGVADHGFGVGHTFNLSVGREGSHVGHGGVVTTGPNAQVATGGHTRVDRFGPRGGTFARGMGHRTHAWTRNRVRHR